MFTVMIVNVVSRYVLFKPIAWADELCNYLFIWMSFLASAYVMGNDGHVRVTALESRLPQKVRNIVHFSMNVIMLVMFAAVHCAFVSHAGETQAFKYDAHTA